MQQPKNPLFDMMRSIGRSHAAIMFGKNTDATKQVGDDLINHAIKGLGTNYTRENHGIVVNKLKEILTKLGYEKPEQVRQRLDTAGFDSTDYKAIITNLDHLYAKDGYKKNVRLEGIASSMGLGHADFQAKFAAQNDASRIRPQSTYDSTPEDNDSGRIRPQTPEPDTTAPAVVSKPNDSASSNVVNHAKKQEPQQKPSSSVVGFQKQGRDTSQKKKTNVSGF